MMMTMMTMMACCWLPHLHPNEPPLPEPDGDAPMSDDGDADESAAAAGGGGEQEQEAEAGEEAPPRADGRARRATAGHVTHDSQEGYG